MKDIFKKIDESVARLNFAWGAYEKIFNDTPERRKLFEETSQFFFANLYSMLSDYIILCISRLTDPPPKNKDPNKDVLSLEYLVNDSKQLEDCHFSMSLENKYKQIQNYVENIRTHRKKRVAHSDQNSALGKVKLPEIHKQDVQQAVHAINDFMQTLHARLNGAHRVYNHAAADGGAVELLYALKDGLYCRDLLSEGKIDAEAFFTHSWRDA